MNEQVVLHILFLVETLAVVQDLRELGGHSLSLCRLVRAKIKKHQAIKIDYRTHNCKRIIIAFPSSFLSSHARQTVTKIY
jgi:hypothetical protein